MQIKKTKQLEGGQPFKMKKKKEKMNKIVGIDLKRVSGPTLHKYNPGIYIIYVWTSHVSRTKKMRIWSSGKISLCQGEDAGSIPAIRPRVNLL